MTATEEQKKGLYDPKLKLYWPSRETLRRSMWRAMPWIDERIKEDRLD